LRKSPKKASPGKDISLKRSPRKKKLGANTSPSKNFIQSILSPEKLSPSKAKTALSVVNAPPPILNLSSMNRSLTALKCSPGNAQNLEDSLQSPMVFSSSISMSNMAYGSRSSKVYPKRITSDADCSSKGYLGASNLPACTDTDLFRIRKKRLWSLKVADESKHPSKPELNTVENKLGANPYYDEAIDTYNTQPPKSNAMILPEYRASESYQFPTLSVSGSPSSQKTIIDINSDESSPPNSVGTSTRTSLVSQRKILLTDLGPVPVDHKVNFGRSGIVRPAIAVSNTNSSTDELLKPIPDKTVRFPISRPPKRRGKSAAMTLDILSFCSPSPKNLPKESLIEEDVYVYNTFYSDGPDLDDSAVSEAEMSPKNQALITEGALKLSSKRLLKRSLPTTRIAPPKRANFSYLKGGSSRGNKVQSHSKLPKFWTCEHDERDGSSKIEQDSTSLNLLSRIT
jgi:hypothetical protein